MRRSQRVPDAAAGSAEFAAPPGSPAARLEGNPGLDSRLILGVRVDATSYAETTERIVELASAGAGGTVCVANVHLVMEAFDDPDFRRGVNAADRVTPDGVPLVWALGLLGVAGAGRVYGPSLTPIVCARAAELGLPVGFFGGSPEVLDAIVGRLSSRFPGLRVAFAHSPPFRPLTDDEDRKLVDAIEDSGARILFVGLGCPKQERWMAEHREALSCVLVGVGAAFDFLAGTKAQAPGWMQRLGLEWVFRLLSEPRRLWRRYLWNNPRFLYRLGLQLARQGRIPG